MNESNLPSSAATPPIHSPLPPKETALGDNPEDHLPIYGALSAIESILRQPRRVLYQLRQKGARPLIGVLLLIAAASGLVYGLIVGTFSGGTQLWVAPAKVTAGLFLSALICFPSLYIFSCLSGSRAKLAEVFGLVAGLLAILTILLVGFAPVAWIFSQSTESINAMGALHLIFFLLSTYFGLRFLFSGFEHLNARSNGGLRLWFVIFLLVMLQMTAALRPVIGKSDSFLPGTKKFFVTYWVESLNENTHTGRR